MLRVGAAVLAFSQGRWWRGRVASVEGGGWVVLSFPGWGPEWHERHHQTALQHDPDAPALGWG